MPRWMKGLLIVTVLAAIVLAVALVASGEHHGPGRHAALAQWS